jgi:hypothetical protein
MFANFGTACGAFLEAPFAEPDDALDASLMLSSLNGLIDTELRELHHAGRGDQADHERVVERGRQDDRNDPAGRDRMMRR